MANFTSISTGAAANAATVNAPLGQLDTAIGALASLATTDKTSLVAAVNELRNNALVGGIYVTHNQLKDWVESEAYEATAVTYDTTYALVAASATVKWPDGSAGVFTATTINGVWETIDAYTVTHATSGYTVTQSVVIRDINGQVVTKPALTVA
ncbi:MAG: hypothetical protein IT367_20400 [Candidatus Hydrogenedentes bacterium]|nr:hypothetical protein [Candidatus Hydrogenedentota bacterium]